MGHKWARPKIINTIAYWLRISSYITSLEKNIALHNTRLRNLSKEVTAVKEKVQYLSAGSALSSDHRFDRFYKAFEDTFRGSEEVIRDRLLEYVPLFTSLPSSTIKKPVIDIGCGRGEFLSIMRENGFRAVGIDMNDAMVECVKDMGLEAYATDARSYLASLKSSSVAAITGFHIVEHIPFESLMDIFSECYRSVARGGFVLFETPNPETFSVGAHTFYLDPSHQRPVPPQLLQFMLEYVGFACEIIRLHEVEETPKSTTSEVVRKLHKSAYGPADYAVVGRKM